MSDPHTFAAVPMKTVGPLLLAGPEVEGEVSVPLATYESPLWPSVDRGARVTRACGGLKVVVVDERMTRSVVLRGRRRGGGRRRGRARAPLAPRPTCRTPPAPPPAGSPS